MENWGGEGGERGTYAGGVDAFLDYVGKEAVYGCGGEGSAGWGGDAFCVLGGGRLDVVFIGVGGWEEGGIATYEVVLCTISCQRLSQ